MLDSENIEAYEVLQWYEKDGLAGVKMYEEINGEIKDIWIWEKIKMADNLIQEMQNEKLKQESKRSGK